jgi:hypothetical protein
MKGDFVGIGVSFFHGDSVTIIKPVANGPSARELRREIDFICRQNEAFGKLPSDSLFSDSKEKKRFRVQLIIYRKSENKN